jgi:hypothetical protein
MIEARAWRRFPHGVDGDATEKDWKNPLVRRCNLSGNVNGLFIMSPGMA